jgi:hypothetical protein
MKILVYDHGLNTEAAIALAAAGHTVGYYSEWREAFPRCVNESVGLGLEGLERVNKFLTAADRSDMICCFDTNSDDVVEFFKQQSSSLPVFGAGSAEPLEKDRSLLKDILKAAKLPVAKYQIIKGVDSLIDFLRKPENKNVFVKIDGQFRGDNETFHHENWQQTMADELGHLLVSFGAFSKKVEFMVEWPVESKCEVGYDGFACNGSFTDGLIGYESKDKSYAAVFREYNKMPACIQLTNNAVSAVFSRSRTPTIFSTELRLKSKDDYYLIDPCVRAPHPPLAAELEHFSNFAEVVTTLAQGQLLNPTPTAKYSVAVEVKAESMRDHWYDVKFDARFRHLIKLQRACRVDGTYYSLPGSVVVCNVVGLGNTLKAAKAECIRALDTVKVAGMEYDLDSLDLIEEETIPAGVKMGIEF